MQFMAVLQQFIMQPDSLITALLEKKICFNWCVIHIAELARYKAATSAVPTSDTTTSSKTFEYDISG